MSLLHGPSMKSNTLHLSKQYSVAPWGSSLWIIRDTAAQHKWESPLDGRQLTAGDIWQLLLSFTSQSTTSSTSLAPSNPLILADTQNTPISSDTLPPKPMPTSTPCFLQTIPLLNNLPTTAVPATSPEAFLVYALPIIRTFCPKIVTPKTLR